MSFLRKSLLLLAAFAMLSVAPGLATALPLGSGFATSGDNDGGPDLNDVFNLLTGGSVPNNGGLLPAVVDNCASLNGGECFMGGEYIAILISSSAGRLNDVGFYTDLGVGSATQDLFSGVTGFGFLDDNGDGSGAFQSVSFTSQGPFGLFNHTVLSSDPANQETWHSESALDASPSHLIDHFISFALGDVTIQTQDGLQQLSNAILVGIEDLRWDFSDDDYDDLTLVIAKVADTPLPEPADSLLVVTGLVGLALLGRRRSDHS